MCGIIGYVGTRECVDPIMQALARLEYRGYDSAGIAALDTQAHQICFVRTEGGVQELSKKLVSSPLDGLIGIGNTRWATHGGSSERNAHPHCDMDRTVAVVHNGVIENYLVLKAHLIDTGVRFHSDTDTEVISHLFSSLLSFHTSVHSAVVDLIERLRGAYAFTALIKDMPDTLLAVRKGSPLCVGLGGEQAFVASDVVAFSDKTNRVVFLPDKSFAFVKKGGIEVFDFSGRPMAYEVTEIDCSWAQCEKGDFEHFMLKEIHEQKRVIHDTVYFCKTISNDIWRYSGVSEDLITKLKRLIFFACGSSVHAARCAAFYFEKLCLVHASAFIASEFRYVPLFVEEQALYCAVSQSGETADTLEAMRMVNALKVPTFAVTNVPSSTLVREAQGFLLTQAKMEVAVASTKSFVAQLATLFWLAHRVALQKNLITKEMLATAEQDLLIAAEVLENSMQRYERDIVNRLAPLYAGYKRFIFTSRQSGYPFAQEAALKFKQVAYLFVDCFPAGELKHGALALITRDVPVFLFSVLDSVVYRRLINDARTIKARGGHLVVFAFEGQDELIGLADTVFIFPQVNALLGSFIMAGVVQLCAYEIARVFDLPIDRPRNMTKAITID